MYGIIANDNKVIFIDYAYYMPDFALCTGIQGEAKVGLQLFMWKIIYNN